MSIEEILINKIEASIRGIRIGTKKPKDVAHSFAKLKTVNEGMHDDLMVKYKNVIGDFNKKHKE